MKSTIIWVLFVDFEDNFGVLIFWSKIISILQLLRFEKSCFFVCLRVVGLAGGFLRAILVGWMGVWNGSAFPEKESLDNSGETWKFANFLIIFDSSTIIRFKEDIFSTLFNWSSNLKILLETVFERKWIKFSFIV